MPGRRATEEQRREQILAAALRVATQNGLSGVTIRSIATETGLSTGSVFFHYKTKEALLLALLDSLIGWLVGSGDRSSDLQTQPNFLDLFRQEVELQGDDRARVGLFLEYMVLGSRNPDMSGRIQHALVQYRELFQPLAQTILEGQRNTMANIQPEELAAFMVSLVIGGSLQQLLDPRPGTTEELLHVTAALFPRH